MPRKTILESSYDKTFRLDIYESPSASYLTIFKSSTEYSDSYVFATSISIYDEKELRRIAQWILDNTRKEDGEW
jgi:hypothetical protein